MDKLQQYKAKLNELQGTLQSLQPQKILNDKAIQDSEELFTKEFQTTDLNFLVAKCTAYETDLAAKEVELAELDNIINSI